MDVATSLLDPELRFLSETVKTIKSDSLWVQLPQACWKATGGDDASSRLATTAFLTGTLALKTLDDVQDHHSVPEKSNEGMALSFHVLQLLALFPALNAQQQIRLQNAYITTILKLCSGQQLDLLAENQGEGVLEGSWITAERKTGEWFAWGASLYALYRGDSVIESVLRKFGMHIGLMHQLANDFRGFFDASDMGDLKGRKLSIPIAYLFTVLPKSPFANEFHDLWQRVGEDSIARERLIEIGCQSGVAQYVRLMTLHHAQQARLSVGEKFPALVNLVDHQNLRIP